jgi:hypothetical protein
MQMERFKTGFEIVWKFKSRLYVRFSNTFKLGAFTANVILMEDLVVIMSLTEAINDEFGVSKLRVMLEMQVYNQLYILMSQLRRISCR